jgi:hypothetical protein
MASHKPYSKLPIRIIPTDSFNVLSERSRLNFGKPISVEHNLRMKDVGQIDPDDFPRVLRYFDEENKTTYSQAPHGEQVLISTGSRRRSSSYASSRHSRAESIPEKEHNDDEDDDQVEDEGNGGRSQTTRRRDSDTSQTHRNADMEYQVYSTHSRRSQGYYNRGMPPRERSNTTRSSPYPVRSRQVSARTAVHNRSRTEVYPSPHPENTTWQKNDSPEDSIHFGDLYD